MSVDRNGDVKAHRGAIQHGAITNHNAHRGRRVGRKVEEVSQAGLEEVVNAFAIHQNHNTMVSNSVVDAKRLRQGHF